ncbi:MAG: hypothetical protein IPP19_16450 [Verrucomicrobia bacterium]|nr:hypothetical protein [Verrucomicrobiota bacterium]
MHFIKRLIWFSLSCASALVAPTLNAQTNYNLTVKAGPLRHSFQGFGASQLASNDWASTPAAARETMADMVYRDLNLNVVRLWATNLETRTLAQDLDAFNTASRRERHDRLAQSAWVTTLLLAPETGTSAGHIAPLSVSAYAESLAEFILQLKNTYNVSIDVTGICNEPDEATWGHALIVDCVKYLRTSLDSRGLTNVKIIAPESSSGAAPSSRCRPRQGRDRLVESLRHRFPRLWHRLGKQRHGRSQNGKFWWTTESCPDYPSERAENEDCAVQTLARFLCEVNHGCEWIYFLGWTPLRFRELTISQTPLWSCMMVKHPPSSRC